MIAKPWRNTKALSIDYWLRKAWDIVALYQIITYNYEEEELRQHRSFKITGCHLSCIEIRRTLVGWLLGISEV